MDNLEQVREQIAQNFCDKCQARKCCGIINAGSLCRGAYTPANQDLSAPILERTCPECGGKGGWLITSTNIGVIQGWQKCECKSGKVPFTVGDAIEYALKELGERK